MCGSCRYFLRRIATRILLVEGCKLHDFKGDYEYYLEQVRLCDF